MRAIEFFAGIGGLKAAAPAHVEVVAAYDQDRAAGLAHEANHGVPVLALDLASVSASELRRHEADCWLLSPPCQPFTKRNSASAGRDEEDPRCAGLLRLIGLLGECRPVQVLLENVPGFHGSRAHARLIAALEAIGHETRDVEHCPSEMGAPLRRRRQFVVSSVDGLAAGESATGPAAGQARAGLETFLDAEPDPSLRVAETVRARVADHLPMAGPNGLLGTFTRSYGRAISGAGPIRWDASGPRYFSPEEILRLHEFPETFRFPAELDLRTRWRLAGNSVHVGSVRHVASLLPERVPGKVSARKWGQTTLLLLALAGAACQGGDPAPPEAPAVAMVTAEPDACAGCHAEETKRWLDSGHRLASRAFGDQAQPHGALVSPEAAILPAGRDAASFAPGVTDAMRAPDASGATEARPMTRVLGGRRREDFLSPRPDGLHVLPLSWSVTRSAWTDPAAEEHGAAIDPAGALGWTAPLRAHASACSRCHPAGATDDAPGITCSTCHPEARDHARAAAAGTPPSKQNAPSRDPWNGCGPCHAVGFDMPRVAGATGALLDALLPDTLVLPEGFNPSFALDGRPLVPHGREAQSLAQSACFMKGGATCLTCHDPHGGEGTSLKQADPDASCRSCHATIAENAAAHARHPVEASGRLPGCVDCHMPAILPFSPADAVRDHAIDVPDPGSARRLGVADACSSCHPSWSEKRLAPALGDASSPPRRRARARTFTLAAAALFGGGGEEKRREALAGSRAMLADAGVDPWTKASAAALVGMLARGAGNSPGGEPELVAALEAAWGVPADPGADPVLRRAIAAAHAAVGGRSAWLAAMLEDEADWRVRVALASALAGARDPRGAQELEALRRDATLPARAHAEAAFELSSTLLASGSSARAEALLLESLRLWPGNAAAWVNLGTLRANAGNLGSAREAWARALEISPGNPMARANLASADASADAESTGAAP